jgi:bacillolysin
MRRLLLVSTAIAFAVLSLDMRTGAQQLSLATLRPTSDAELRTINAQVEQMERSGQLRLRSADRDPAFPARVAERLQQFYQGIPVFGADIVRDSDQGLARMILGTVVPELSIQLRPSLSEEQASATLRATAGDGSSVLGSIDLVILPLADGAKLAYMAVLSASDGVFRIFVDAGDGSELLKFSELQSQAAVVQGRGVLGDQKKMSVMQQAGAFFADDKHRPPVLTTFDMRDNLGRAIAILNGSPVFTADMASNVDNSWDDPVAVDAHVNIGWTYDYFFKRFGRRGLDNRDRRIMTIIHGVSQNSALLIGNLAGTFAINAFWCSLCGPGGTGAMYFGDGIPPGFFLTSNGRNYGYFAAALDIAAHELTHGVTDSSSGLIYMNESGALNEAFSDIMATGVEFFYQPVGGLQGQADYTLGEDIVRAVRPGALNGDRSLSDPGAYGDPDHYSRRYLGALDNGGVHTNSGIANHAFFLAIEGGTNRTSGISVTGVGHANRDQIERAFYRGFVFMLPASATFSMARTATVQAARDLFGAASPAQAAIAQAWAAVGVN